MQALRRVVWRLVSWWVVWRSGLFDLAWYARQLEHRSPPRPLAIAHYIWRGRAAGLSPHPLFEPSWYAPRDWRTRHVDPFAAFLRRGEEATSSAHPLFDPRVWTARHPEAAGARGGPLGHFAATATPDTQLPVEAGLLEPHAGAAVTTETVITWKQGRAALVTALARWRRDETRRRAPRVSGVFDHEAEARLVARCAERPLPPTAGGEPLVSVILPVRDRRVQVVDAVTSVQAQTLDRWELIAVDDGSTDGTGDVLRELAEADPRIRVVTRAPAAGGTAGGWTGGVCAARNAGAADARGRYVAWLDSDNTWTPHFLRTMVTELTRLGRPLGYAAAELVWATGSRYRGLDAGDDQATVLALLEVANHIDLNVLVAERSLLAEVGGFDETLRRTVDYDLVWRLAKREVPAYVPVVGAKYDADHEAVDRITVRELASWREVVKSRRLIDWAGLRRDVADRVPGRLSVVVVAGTSWMPAWVSVTSVLRAAAAGDDVEVILVDDGGRRPDALVAATLPLLDGRVRVVRTPVRAGPALAFDLGLAASTGAVVAAVEAGVEVWPGWSAPLATALDDPTVAVAAPLARQADGTIRCAGLAWADGAAEPPDDAPPLVPALRGLTADDARRAGDLLPAVATGQDAFAVRAADAVTANGLDPLYVTGLAAADLSLRLPGVTVIATRSTVSRAHRLRPGTALPATPGPTDEAVRADEHLLAARLAIRAATLSGALAVSEGVGSEGVASGGVASEGVGSEGVGSEGVASDQRAGQLGVPSPWAAAGFQVAGWTWGRPPTPLLVRPEATGPGGVPSLRWSIRTALPVSPEAARWGDLHFAYAVAEALERLGQQVVVDYRPAMARPAAVPDDVVLVLRGLEAAPARAATPRAVRLMWVISHPEAVGDEELRGVDRVFAASPSWAARVGAEAGVEVVPLLQATDPQRFSPEAAAADTGDRVLFVGNSRNVFRPVVRHLVEAGIDVAVYGGKWERFLGPGQVRASYVPNDRLAAAYRSAGVVLNDHWDDMRAEGFYSNRLFDAAACAARIVSDHIDGLEELFGGLARTFTSPSELVSLVEGAPNGFPGERERLALAARVAAEHSFDARAATLLAEALRVRG